MSDPCTPCTTTTPPCWAPGNTCSALFTLVLSRIGAPAPGAHNLGMLLAWSHGECSPGDARCNPFAGNNPLATTWGLGVAGGCWSCDPACFVHCYDTLAHGAAAIADTLENGAYPTILAALRGDWTLCEWQCLSSIHTQLGVWGTGSGWLGACPAGGCASCAGVTCGACATCSGGVCVDACAPGDTCVAGICTPPVSPPPSSTSSRLLIAGTIVTAITGLALWEANRHPEGTRVLVAHLEGGPASIGGIRGAQRRPGRPQRVNPMDRPARAPERRGGVPVGESLGAGLARRR